MERPEFSEALAVAYKALAKHEKFTSEIRALLEKKGFVASTIEEVVDYMASRNILNDRRCAELAIARLNKKGDLGRARLAAALEARGTPSDVLEAVLPSEPDQGQLISLLAKRFPGGADIPKAVRYLCSRGFDEEAALAAAEAAQNSNSPSEVT